MVAWTLLTADARPVFRAALAVDDATWGRARGWALSVAVIILPYYKDTNPVLSGRSSPASPDTRSPKSSPISSTAPDTDGAQDPPHDVVEWDAHRRSPVEPTGLLALGPCEVTLRSRGAGP